MPGRTAADVGGSMASRGGTLLDALLDQPVPLKGRMPLEEDGEPVKTELQCGGAAEGGGGVSVRPGQQHSHRGKVQAAVRKSCVGVGQGIPSSLGNSPMRQEV